MEQRLKTLALLQQYYDFFNAAHTDGMLTLLSDDVIHEINQGEAEQGIMTFRNFFTRMNRCYREQVNDLQLFVNHDGTRAAAEFVVEGAYLATDEGLPEANGQTYHLPAGAFFSLSDDKITRVTMYYNLQQWLKQVYASA